MDTGDNVTTGRNDDGPNCSCKETDGFYENPNSII